MEALIVGYGVFVLATTFLVLVTMFIPIVRRIYNTEPTPKIVESGNRFLIYTALTIFCMLAAPFMFVIWLFPDYTARFTESLYDDLKKT